MNKANKKVPTVSYVWHNTTIYIHARKVEIFHTDDLSHSKYRFSLDTKQNLANITLKILVIVYYMFKLKLSRHNFIPVTTGQQGSTGSAAAAALDAAKTAADARGEVEATSAPSSEASFVLCAVYLKEVRGPAT